MKRVVVHVGKLVLHGLPPGQARGIGAAVERELARLAAEPAGPFASVRNPGGPGDSGDSGDMARAVGSRLRAVIQGKSKP